MEYAAHYQICFPFSKTKNICEVLANIPRIKSNPAKIPVNGA